MLQNFKFALTRREITEEQATEIIELATKLAADYFLVEATRKPNIGLLTNVESMFDKERINICFIFVLFAAFGSVTPWQYFKKNEAGRKMGCDVKISLPFVFAPISIYNPSFLGFLRFLSIVLLIAGAVLLLAIGFLLGQRRSEKDRREFARLLEGVGYGDRFKNRILQIVVPEFEEEYKAFSNIIAYVCGVILILIVATVETTIIANKIDLSLSPVSSTSQIIAMTVGISTSLTMVWHALNGSQSLFIDHPGREVDDIRSSRRLSFLNRKKPEKSPDDEERGLLQ